MRAIAGSLADQLGVEPPATDGWQNGRSPGANLERFVLLHALGPDPRPLVWAIDEADRLFGLSFRADLFGLLRSWHNARALDPAAAWSRLCVILAHATEAALFIPDAHQSPFNVGTHVMLGDFPQPEVEELNRRYGSPLSVPEGLDALVDLVGGHPYLLRKAFHALVTTGKTVDVLAAEARADGGVFADHLDSLLVALQHDADMTEAVKSLVRGGSVDARAFARPGWCWGRRPPRGGCGAGCT